MTDETATLLGHRVDRLQGVCTETHTTGRCTRTEGHAGPHTSHFGHWVSR